MTGIEVVVRSCLRLGVIEGHAFGCCRPTVRCGCEGRNKPFSKIRGLNTQVLGFSFLFLLWFWHYSLCSLPEKTEDARLFQIKEQYETEVELVKLLFS